jgi:RNA polymerase sigma-70 factor (ECF subfamily)
MDIRQPATEPSARPITDQDVVVAFETHRLSLERYVRSLVRDPDDAADICQEVFVRLLLATRENRAPETPKAWMHRVAHNLVVSAARHRSVAERSAERVVEAQTVPSTEDDAIRREETAGLANALGSVRPDDRRAMILAAQGFRTSEIGQAIGRTDLATRALLCRARGRLRQQLATTETAGV